MRLMLLFKKELFESKKSLLIYSLTIFLVLFVQEMLNEISAQISGIEYSTSGYGNLFPGFLLLGGFIITGLFFAQDMFNRIGQHNWLMLPASALEKYLAKALTTAFLYPAALTLHVTFSSVIIEGITSIVFSTPFHIFNPLTASTGMLLLHYIVLQSLFLLGATLFRKVHFVKTVLSIASVAVILSIIGGVFMRIVFAPYFSGLFLMDITVTGDMPEAPALFRGLWIYIRILYWAVMPLFCWVASYLRVKEVQSTDAVS